MPQNSATNTPFVKNYGSPTRIPMPVAIFGKPRGSSRTSEGFLNTSKTNGQTLRTQSRVNHGSLQTTNDVNHGPLGTPNGMINGQKSVPSGRVNRCINCTVEICTCDEGFIDDDVTRTPLRPKNLMQNSQNGIECNNIDSNSALNAIWNQGNDSNQNCKISKCADIPQQPRNGETFPGNGESLEWKEVMTGILNYEENRNSEKNI